MDTGTINPVSFDEIRGMPPEDARGAIRTGSYASHTAGLSAGYLQANLVILPEDRALDFMRFCQRNPKPCPLVGVTDTGDARMASLGAEIDVRSDLPSYNIYHDGKLTGQTRNLSDIWEPGFVGFAIGCSFTFENALARAGIPLWHVDSNKVVPMYRTNIRLRPAGDFGGTMVVSMRSIPAERVEEAVAISARYPWAHGSPVHVGDPSRIGIADLARPDWGDSPPADEGSVPCFWACGVTPQAVALDAGLPLVITHTPGHMLITDVPEDAEVPLVDSPMEQN